MADHNRSLQDNYAPKMADYKKPSKLYHNFVATVGRRKFVPCSASRDKIIVV